MSTPPAAAGKQQLCALLVDATSQDIARVKSSEALLKSYETSPGYHATLLDIVLDATVQLESRWLAVICLKNGVEKYWRRSAKGCIPVSEQAQIRTVLLTAFNEPNEQLATQIAVVIAKIARSDYPAQWPDLLHVLFDSIRRAADLDASMRVVLRQRTLYTLLLVIKGLITQRIGASRRMVEQLAPELFQHILQTFREHCYQVFESAGAGVYSEFDLGLVLLSLKCLRKLLVHGMSQPFEKQSVQTFGGMAVDALEQTKALVFALPDGFAASNPANKAFATTLAKLCKQFGKLYLDLQEYQGLDSLMLSHSDRLYAWYWSLLTAYQDIGVIQMCSDDKVPVVEQFLIHGLLLFKGLVKLLGSVELEDGQLHAATPAHTRQAFQQLSSILSQSFVVALCELLVLKIMRLTRKDFAAWSDDVERWILDEESDTWEWNVRSCAEKLLLALMYAYADLLGPLLAGALQTATAIPLSQDPDQLLIKDSVYAAVAACADKMSNVVDFDTLLTTHLVHEARADNTFARYLRRRIAHLIKHWVCVKCSPASRPVIYELLLFLLEPAQDLAVRITAVEAFHRCIDDWDFAVPAFLPYVSRFVDLSLRLLGDLEELDCRMKVLNCMAVTVDALDKEFIPYAEQVISVLPGLWEASASEHLFQSSMLNLLTKLVPCLREGLAPLQQLIVPLIVMGVDTEQPSSVYLMEDALALWEATLQSSTALTPDLAHCLSFAMRLLEFGSEHLPVVLRVMESYLMLDIVAVQAYWAPMLQSLCQLLGDGTSSASERLRPQASNLITHVVLTLLETTAGGHERPAMEAMYSSGILTRLLHGLVAQTDHTLSIVGYISVLARACLADVDAFVQACANQLDAVINAWVDKWDNIGHPYQRKLSALALTHLLSARGVDAGSHAASVVSVWTDILHELKSCHGGASGQRGSDDRLLLYGLTSELADDAQENGESSPGAQRKAQLLKRDVVITTNLQEFIRFQMTSVAQAHGDATSFWEHLMASQQLDRSLYQTLQQLLVQQA
ncbi:hypothetical protein RI367_003873 [Sorochytrium milnesiophthora]